MKIQHQKPKTGKMAAYVVLLIAAFFLMYALKTCSNPVFNHTVKNGSGGDTLDIGIEYGPMTLYREGDTLGGFSYDLLRLIGRQGELNLKFHPIVTISEALQGLDNGRFDIVVASVPLTTSISERYAVTQPIYIDKQLLIQRIDSTGNATIDTQLKLAGKTVHVAKDSPVADRLRTLASEIGDTIIIVEDDDYGSEHLVIMVSSGEIDHAVVNEQTARKMAARLGNIDISTAVSFNQFQPWLLRTQDSLLRIRLDSLILLTKQNGIYDRLNKKYLIPKE